MARKIAIPHTYVIVFSFIIAAAVLTWILPGGEFEREMGGAVYDHPDRYRVVVANPYRYNEPEWFLAAI